MDFQFGDKVTMKNPFGGQWWGVYLGRHKARSKETDGMARVCGPDEDVSLANMEDLKLYEPPTISQMAEKFSEPG